MTRMWMVDPKIMCGHLVGEYFETHVIATNIKGRTGHSRFHQEYRYRPQSVEKRHNEPAAEM